MTIQFIHVLIIVNQMGGSALTKLNSVYGIRREDWRRLQKNEERTIWRNELTSQQLEEYEFVVNDSSEFKTERQVFEMRYRSETLVSSKYLHIDEKNQLCSTTVRGSVFIERIPVTLADINQIPFPDILHFYSQSFKGFSELWSRFGYFDILEDLVGCNYSGKVKVWMNSSLDAIRPEINYLRPEGTEIDMLQKLMQLLDLNTNQSQHSQALYLFINSKRPRTFADAHIALEEYYSAHRIQIPHCSPCVVAMLSAVKESTSKSLTYRNPFSSPNNNTPITKALSPEANQYAFRVKDTYSQARPSSLALPKINQVIAQRLEVPFANPKPVYLQSPRTFIVGGIQHQFPKGSKPRLQSLSSPKTLSVRNVTPIRANERISVINTKPLTQTTYYAPSTNIKSSQLPSRYPRGSISPQANAIQVRDVPNKLQSQKPKMIPNSQYYTTIDHTINSGSKFTSTSALMNRFTNSKPPERALQKLQKPSPAHNNRSYNNIQTKSIASHIKNVPIERTNRFNAQSSSKFDSIIMEAPKQEIVYVNPKENSSFATVPQKTTKQIVQKLSSLHQHPTVISRQYSYKEQEAHSLYQSSQQQPLFPPRQIINVRGKQQQTYATQSPRGSVYMVNKQTSSYDAPFTNQDYREEDVKISEEIRRVISEQRKAIAESGLQQKPNSEYNEFARRIQSPVQFRLKRGQYNHAFKQQFSNSITRHHTLDTQTTRNIDVQHSNMGSERIGFPQDYLNLISSDIKEDFISMKVRINSQLGDYNQK